MALVELVAMFKALEKAAFSVGCVDQHCYIRVRLDALASIPGQPSAPSFAESLWSACPIRIVAPLSLVLCVLFLHPLHCISALFSMRFGCRSWFALNPFAWQVWDL